MSLGDTVENIYICIIRFIESLKFRNKRKQSVVAGQTSAGQYNNGRPVDQFPASRQQELDLLVSVSSGSRKRQGEKNKILLAWGRSYIMQVSWSIMDENMIQKELPGILVLPVECF